YAYRNFCLASSFAHADEVDGETTGSEEPLPLGRDPHLLRYRDVYHDEQSLFRMGDAHCRVRRSDSQTRWLPTRADRPRTAPGAARRGKSSSSLGDCRPDEPALASD